ncbi:pentapeptide repeat-containing protein [Streptomyces milbemycinicus]|uniref:pentapeptide repeat-containing protein n=1 Tax=Streptomyces milbemycinicus TaxID=476552 RepID=UPI0034079BFA
MTTSTPPNWPHCGHAADPATDPVGCRGIHVPGHTVCLAHLESAARAAYFEELQPGGDVDHRGTAFDENLLVELLNALYDTRTRCPTLGEARFDGAIFTERAHFDGATFTKGARFVQVTFEEVAWFFGARFMEGAQFTRSSFDHLAMFDEAIFDGDISFYGAEFSASASFNDAQFIQDVSFGAARFSTLHSLGPFRCNGTLDFSMAVFAAPVTIEANAERILCQRARWESTATLRFHHSTLDLSDAVINQPVAIVDSDRWLPHLESSGIREGVRITSLRGVDAAQLTLTNVDLSQCWFSGAFHLDQLRLEGNCRFSLPPRFRSKRRVLAEERNLRAQGRRFPVVSRWLQWGMPEIPDQVHTLPEPYVLAGTYRQLRKAFEDAKDEPGAADFYYGEMEMRRHKRNSTPRAERLLLRVYWLLSGYGLRASRALGWLATAMMATILLMMGFGLPTESPKQTATGTVPADGGKVSFEIDKEDPRNPTGDRFTSKRFDKALNVTINSVVFRSSGQDFTTAGTYIEMASRLSEPVLLGFAGLAIRGRVKRGS